MKSVNKGIKTAYVAQGYLADRLIYKDMHLDVKINQRDKLITLNGIRYSFELFNSMATFKLYTPFVFVQRGDGSVTIQENATFVGNN